VLEALVFAGIDPPLQPEVDPAPGERAARAGAPPADALASMLAATREAEGAKPLVRVAELDRVALEQAEAMRGAGRIGHDLGGGDPVARVQRSLPGVTLSGENVALAASAPLAHRRLYASPSHRANMLSDQFDSVGVGAVADARGMLWVCQIFATLGRSAADFAVLLDPHNFRKHAK
jgi:uncharacterized protein YkwD